MLNGSASTKTGLSSRNSGGSDFLPSPQCFRRTVLSEAKDLLSTDSPERNASSACWLTADAYLFDIDGTLLNTTDRIHYDAFHHAVREVFGVDSKIDGVPVHGNTDIGILRAVLRREGLSDSDFESRLPLAIAQMCTQVTRNAAFIRSTVCPSIVELLDRLVAMNKILGVASGNLEKVGWLKLEAANLRRYFSFGSFCDQTELREDIFRNGIFKTEHLLGRKATVCVVGDTPADIKAARKLSIPIIAVATGIYSIEQLREHGPDTCIPCCTDILQYF